MPNIQRSAPELIGESIKVSYVSGPLGKSWTESDLLNPGTINLTAKVNSVWLEIEGQRQILDDITVFDLNEERIVNPEDFKVDATTTIRFILGFPRILYEPRFGESVAVGLGLSVNDVELQALSSPSCSSDVSQEIKEAHLLEVVNKEMFLIFEP